MTFETKFKLCGNKMSAKWQPFYFSLNVLIQGTSKISSISLVTHTSLWIKVLSSIHNLWCWLFQNAMTPSSWWEPWMRPWWCVACATIPSTLRTASCAATGKSVNGKTEFEIVQTRSKSWLLMPWFPAFQRHQQQWYYLRKMSMFLSLPRLSLKNLHHFSVEEYI